jgi:hypothetical protein
MRGSRFLGSLLLGFAMLLPLATAGCAHHYYGTYGPGEDVYYNQWVVENHRDAHVDYHHLSKEDQKHYWDWRHNHAHDHDHQ